MDTKICYGISFNQKWQLQQNSDLKNFNMLLYQAFFNILALRLPSAACLMLSASFNHSTSVKYLNQMPERGSLISIEYVMPSILPKFDEHIIQIYNKYNLTLEGIFQKSICPKLYIIKKSVYDHNRKK